MDPKTKGLVAIAASIATNCQPCMKYHLKIARSSGATEEEIKDMMEMAKAVKMKSAMVMDEFAEEILSSAQKSSNERCQNKGSGSDKECCS